jgi:hypothetical protein
MEIQGDERTVEEELARLDLMAEVYGDRQTSLNASLDIEVERRNSLMAQVNASDLRIRELRGNIRDGGVDHRRQLTDVTRGMLDRFYPDESERTTDDAYRIFARYAAMTSDVSEDWVLRDLISLREALLAAAAPEGISPQNTRLVVQTIRREDAGVLQWNFFIAASEPYIGNGDFGAGPGVYLNGKRLGSIDTDIETGKKITYVNFTETEDLEERRLHIEQSEIFRIGTVEPGDGMDELLDARQIIDNDQIFLTKEIADRLVRLWNLRASLGYEPEPEAVRDVLYGLLEQKRDDAAIEIVRFALSNSINITQEQTDHASAAAPDEFEAAPRVVDGGDLDVDQVDGQQDVS